MTQLIDNMINAGILPHGRIAEVGISLMTVNCQPTSHPYSTFFMFGMA